MRSHDPVRIFSFVSVLCVAAIVVGLVLIARKGSAGRQPEDPSAQRSAIEQIKKLEKSRDAFRRKAQELKKDLELKEIELEKAKAELSRRSKSGEGANPM